MKRPLISDEWAREYHCPESTGFRDGIMLSPLTFCGALEEFYRLIARDWNNETRVKYDRDYNNVILPHIKNHNYKIITSYTKEECENILTSIQTDGYVSKGEKQEYSDTQMNHFKYLIYSVFQHAATAGRCRDFLWGTKFEVSVEREVLAVRSKTQIKKSLTIIQEKSLIEQLMDTPREDGRRIALLLMFSLGLRDGEACGLDFGDIYELPYHRGCFVAVIKQSTIPKTSILQSSGKTWNSGRRIPIPTKVLKFVLERKKILSDIIEEKGFDIDIDRVPVASKGYIYDDTVEFKTRLRADNVTEEARDVFKQVGIAPEILSSLEVEMDEENARLEVTESNVTAYLLRRNFATHLKILGLEYPDIQYLLGHCIEDPYINRPDYTDSKLYELSKQMANRPLVNDEIESKQQIPCFSERRFSGRKELIIESNATTLKVQIHAVEKEDKLSIRVKSNNLNGCQISIFEEYKSYESHRGMDIIQKYRDDYK